MQQRNLIVFAILSILLVGSWYFFIGPPDFSKDKDDPNKKVVQNTDKDKQKPEEKKPEEKDKKPEEKEKKNPEIKIDKDKEPVKKPEPEKQPAKDGVAVKATLGG